MAHILIMPRQGNTVESCIITNWNVKEGDTVTAETIICEVETDKAAFEVPAEAEGTVLKLLCESGDDVPVLSPIAVIGTLGENWQTALGDASKEATSTIKIPTESKPIDDSKPHEEKSNPTNNASLPIPQSPIPDPQSPISPRARNLAKKEAFPLNKITGSGPGGRIIERDIIAALEERPHLTAAAKAEGAVAFPQSGSGLGGRVSKADISTASSFQGEDAVTETPIKGIRKIISDRMFMSLSQTAQFTLNASASAVKLQEIRSSLKNVSVFASDMGLGKITINDLILFAVSRILPRFPFMNAHKIGDTIKTFERVHLAAAVDTPKGLMVPVIRNANLLSLIQISSEAKRLASSCQNGTVKPDELSGSTFTVTNLGSLGITSFTPILNAPEAAILGVGCIEMKPVSDDGTNKCCCGVHFEPHINFSLTINHQVIDGAPAAKFLKALCEAVARIDLLLTED